MSIEIEPVQTTAANVWNAGPTVTCRIKSIVRRVAAQAGTGVTYEQVMGPLRHHNIVEVRHKAIAAVYKEIPWMSYPQLGRAFGGRDHSTIMHALKKRGELIPRGNGGGGGSSGVKARLYGGVIDVLFEQIGAALNAPNQGAHNENL